MLARAMQGMLYAAWNPRKRAWCWLRPALGLLRAGRTATARSTHAARAHDACVRTPPAPSQACFVLAAICDGHPKGQALCASSNLLGLLLKWLRSMFPPQVRMRVCGGVDAVAAGMGAA